MAASMKMTVFWDVASCSLVDDGGSKHLRNVSERLPDYMVQHPKDSRLHQVNVVAKYSEQVLTIIFSNH
jgi:hypothetical protein